MFFLDCFAIDVFKITYQSIFCVIIARYRTNFRLMGVLLTEQKQRDWRRIYSSPKRMDNMDSNTGERDAGGYSLGSWI